MIAKNYLKVAIRNFKKQKLHAGINLFGLTIGLSVCFLIALFVFNELSYDRFHEKSDRTYLLPMTWHFGGTDLPTGANCTAGGPFMKEVFPEVEEFVRLSNLSLSFYRDNEIIEESKGLYSDSAFFKIFSFPVLLGNPKTALSEPNSIVITRKLAEKYFGNDWSTNILQSSLTSSTGKLYQIKAVCENTPANSHISFDYLVSFNSMQGASNPSWDNSAFYTYVLLNKSANPSTLVSAIPNQLDQKFGNGTKDVIELDLVKLSDVYLHNVKYPLPGTSNIIYVRIFSAIAILVLFIATINYINLATSRAMTRGLEVGVRKVLGAVRNQLIIQFMTESLILTSLSVVLAVGLSKILLPFFNIIAGKELVLSSIATPFNIAILCIACLAIAILAGLYPALAISNYNPVKVLKGKLKDSSTGIMIRKNLVVLQFCISITLIVCTLTVSSQLSFIQNKELGYEHNHLVSIQLDSLSKTKIDAFKNAANSNSFVKGVTGSTQLPIKISFETKINEIGGPEDDYRLIKVWGTDRDMINTMGFKLVTGTNFSETIPDDEWQVIVNESALSFFGWSLDESLGKRLKFWGQSATVVGVINDFHFSSLHNAISPLVIFTGKSSTIHNMLLVNTSLPPLEAATTLETLWKKINPTSPFSLSFLDDRYKNLYANEIKLGNIVKVFAFLAIVISTLGLFGLASYSISQRTKELGIRKVLGATVYNLIGMISFEFVKLIAIAFLIAIPMSYLTMNQWLSEFAYRVNFSWVLVIIAGFSAVGISLIIIGYHAVSVAKGNPIDSLRNE